MRKEHGLGLRIWLAVFGAAAVVFVVFRHWGINLADEGYYYYAVLALPRGEMPIADFQSYDPYRFYWSALWMAVFGDGLLVLRASRAALVATSVALAVTAATRATRQPLALASLGAALLVPGLESVSVFVCGVSLAVVLAVVERPSTRRWCLAGVWTGIAAGIGHNHGLYLAIAFSTLWAWLARSVPVGVGRRAAAAMPRGRTAFAFVAGGFAGFAPMLAHWALFPEMFANFWHLDVLRYVTEGAATVPIPVPWPWIEPTPGTTVGARAATLALGLAFVWLSLVYPVAVAKLRALGPTADSANARLLLAATVLGVPYLHYAFSHADLAHLDHAALPATIVTFSLLSFAWEAAWRRASTTTGAVLLAVIACANLAHSHRLYAMTGRQAYLPVEIGGSTIMVQDHEARAIEAVRDISSRLVGPSEPLWIAPDRTMMYCATDRRSPVWQLFDLYPREEGFQRRMIDELESSGTDWAILSDAPVAGDPARTLATLLPLVRQYVAERFEQVEFAALEPPYRLYRRRLSSEARSTQRRGRLPSGWPRQPA